jgi:hypothetical protein
MKRRELMNAWADWLEGAEMAKVVSICLAPEAAMIRISITAAASRYRRHVPVGVVGCEVEVAANGERPIWIEPLAYDCPTAMRRLRKSGEMSASLNWRPTQQGKGVRNDPIKAAPPARQA